MVTFCGSFELQVEQEESNCEVHRAFNTPLLNNHTLPTRKEEAEDPEEEITREEALFHTQRKEEGEETVEEGERGEAGRENSSPQFNAPVSLVGEVKVTVTLLPSKENSDLRTNGADKASSTPLTTNTSPTGNTTL
jgi:hypothetical protein